MNVLFICRGNVGRSQMAEVLFKQLDKGLNFATSAGVEALGDGGVDMDGMFLKERDSSKYVIECMKEMDVDVSNNKIKRLTPEMVESADKIFMMANPDTAPDYLRDSEKVVYWSVIDPCGRTLESHREIRNEVEKLVRGIIE